MATDTISALGAGSGVDVKSLATNLVEAERAPRKAVLDKKIKASEGGISGYAAIKYVLGDLKTAFSNLKDQSAFNVMTTRNSQPAAFTVTSSATTATGSHSVAVSQLAKPQRSISAGFASNTVSLTTNAPITLSLSVNGATPAQTITVPATANTPEGIVATVNAANKGIKAQLINTGDATNPVKIMFTGNTGASSAFQLTGLEDFFTSLPLADRSLKVVQTAQNAMLNVNGVDIVSATNKVEGAITGTSLDLYATTVVGQPASLDFLRDPSAVKTKIQALVTAYNDATSMLGVVSDPKSSVETYGATLVGNSAVGTVRSQMRSMITTSIETTSGQPNALRDLGLSISAKGVLELDSTKLDAALQNNFEGVVTLLTNNTENLSTFSTAPGGVANAALKKITALLDTSSPLTTQSNNLTTKISGYKLDLEKLETRMTTLLARYNKQFGAMESMVGQSKSLKESLTSTFEGMMAAYTKN